jgi:asparagine synthase (glutamine-hydrolysing)
MARDSTGYPLRWFPSLVRSVSTRSLAIGQHNLAIAASAIGTELWHPFLEPAFLAALRPLGGTLGFPNRTSFMRLVFGELLPADVLARVSKAYFNTAFFGEDCRAFVRAWDGTGLDPAIVRVDKLYDEWNAPEPSGMTFMLLQEAWRASCSHSGGSTA